jgi:hypothetical protein
VSGKIDVTDLAKEILQAFVSGSGGVLNLSDVERFADLALDLASERIALIGASSEAEKAEHRENLSVIERSFQIRFSRFLLDAPAALTRDILPAILRTLLRIFAIGFPV